MESLLAWRQEKDSKNQSYRFKVLNLRTIYFYKDRQFRGGNCFKMPLWDWEDGSVSKALAPQTLELGISGNCKSCKSCTRWYASVILALGRWAGVDGGLHGDPGQPG